jgi:hypothetical protein
MLRKWNFVGLKLLAGLWEYMQVLIFLNKSSVVHPVIELNGPFCRFQLVQV